MGSGGQVEGRCVEGRFPFRARGLLGHTHDPLARRVPRSPRPRPRLQLRPGPPRLP